MNDRKYRFFIHYNKPNDKMTVHFKGKCYIAKNILCERMTNTKWNEKEQPNVVMEGWCEDIENNLERDEIRIY